MILQKTQKVQNEYSAENPFRLHYLPKVCVLTCHYTCIDRVIGYYQQIQIPTL